MDSKFHIQEATILGIQKAFSKNLIQSEELVYQYLERIAKYDHGGIKLNSVLELNADVIHIAKALDYERKNKGIRSNLHGIPILVKDNINTADKMHTSAGSYALKDSYARRDAFLVEKLRQAGAVILGKANMTEWANYMSDHMPAGYSSRGGQVLNPYGINSLSPGGSSAGSGVSVTSNLCCASIGTETSGSIIDPASILGIVGIKPTIGLVSRRGIIPVSYMQDTAGPMTRTVEDAAIILGAIVGFDEEDPITILSQSNGYSDYTRFLDKDSMKGIRIGIPRDYFFDDLSEEEITIVESAVKIIKQLGAEVVDNISIPQSKELSSKTAELYEFKNSINFYLSNLDSHIPVHSLSDLISFNKTHEDIMLKYGQAYFETVEKTTGTLTEEKYVSLRLKELHQSKEKIDAALKEHNLDALLFPGDKATPMVNKAGYPMITVPAGTLKDGSSMGITFNAEAFSEPKLIKLAYSFEQHANKRIPPDL
ncbi:amidase family protein [Anaerocolumna sp. MB42-C2]|uniref:amidase family protein n=1 Tax=Anaerocolumna sp. MB42-C2 TaxID=3070997 RepID=UPI0027E154B7|nr:amidase family protein [Anaerocolumna sp. MB42-C2]WMJ86379.1 amidase family protein [Anaerocolumna sp. MB42-C2]